MGIVILCFVLGACSTGPKEIKNVEIITITNELTSTVIYADEHNVVINEGIFSNDFDLVAGDKVEILSYKISSSNKLIEIQGNNGKTYTKPLIEDVILK